jgi:hypothetical protein
MAIAYPPVIINEYLSEKVVERLPERFSGPLRFFPTQPTDPMSLAESFPEDAADVFGVYDRMFKLRRKPFPHIKCEQLLYYFYKQNNDPEGLIETSQVIQDLLDRGDESAQEINNWIRTHPNFEDGVITFGTGALAREFKPVFFHELKIFQLEEARDIVNFNSARSLSASKIIIDYEYHLPRDANNDSSYSGTIPQL